jgi:GntR family transcriptional regulator
MIFLEEAVYRSDKFILQVNISRREGKIRWN